MIDSVRVRLTIWHGAVLTLVLIVVAFIAYYVLLRSAMRRTDASLSEIASDFLNSTQAHLGNATDQSSVTAAFDYAISRYSTNNSTFCIFDNEERLIVQSSPNSADCRLSLTKQKILDAISASSNRRDVYRTVPIYRRATQLCVQHFALQNKSYVLVALESLHSQHEFFEDVGATFAVFIPIVILLMGLGGYFLAWRTLQPIVAMSTQAARIEDSNLHERLRVRNTEDELGLLAKSFNGLLDRLDQSFARQRQFVADASHELRTPVAILCGECEVALLQSVRSAEEYRESLQVLAGEANRLKATIEDLFTLARADAGQYPLAPTHFYLDETIADCCRSLRALMRKKNMTLSISGEKELQIHADEALIRRMIVNLLDNAIKYSRSDGSIAVDCQREDSRAVITISDSGPGIPEESQTRVFERFFRVDSSRSRAKGRQGGAGLGLAISRWIAESHGGALVLTRSDISGSTFKAVLPIGAESN